jgi:hypothetical protein
MQLTLRWSGPRRRYTSLAVERRACAAAAAQRPDVMRQEQATFSSAKRTWWHGISKRVCTTTGFVVAMLTCVAIGIGAGVWDEVDHSLGPEHPLPIARLALRLVIFVATGVAFAIVSITAFRLGRQANRLREGLCVKCGYDLRASTDHCPECGSPVPAPPAA